MTEEQIAALRGLIARGSGLDINNVIPAHDNGVLPDGLFATAHVVNDYSLGLPAITQHDMGIQGQGEYREAIVAIEWLRAGAYDSALRFGSWVVSDLGRMDTRAAGLTIEPHSPVADASGVIFDSYEKRADCQLRVGYVRLSAWDVGGIERVPLSVDSRPESEIS